MSKRDSLEAIVGPVSRETYDSLVELERQLLVWNRKINLVSSTTTDDVWRRHILDSAQLLLLAKSKHSWIDIGSGGGFPGLVIAILLQPDSAASVTLVESNSKKSGFLKAMTGLFGLRSRVLTDRVENVVESLLPPSIISARALASLADLLGLTLPWLQAGATGLFHKGREYRRELAESADRFKFDLIEHISLVDRESVILEISSVRNRE